MKRHRRVFTKEFKTEVAKQILKDPKYKEVVAKERDILLTLLDRWTNDYIAENKRLTVTQLPKTERRQDYQTIQELKSKIADLYMQLERSQRYSIRAQDSR